MLFLRFRKSAFPASANALCKGINKRATLIAVPIIWGRANGNADKKYAFVARALNPNQRGVRILSKAVKNAVHMQANAVINGKKRYTFLNFLPSKPKSNVNRLK